MTKQIKRVFVVSLACMMMLFCLTGCFESPYTVGVDRAVVAQLGADDSSQELATLNQLAQYEVEYRYNLLSGSDPAGSTASYLLSAELLKSQLPENITTDGTAVGMGSSLDAAVSDMVVSNPGIGAGKAYCGMTVGEFTLYGQPYYIVAVIFAN